MDHKNFNESGKWVYTSDWIAYVPLTCEDGTIHDDFWSLFWKHDIICLADFLIGIATFERKKKVLFNFFFLLKISSF